MYCDYLCSGSTEQDMIIQTGENLYSCSKFTSFGKTKFHRDESFLLGRIGLIKMYALDNLFNCEIYILD